MTFIDETITRIPDLKNASARLQFWLNAISDFLKDESRVKSGLQKINRMMVEKAWQRRVNFQNYQLDSSFEGWLVTTLTNGANQWYQTARDYISHALSDVLTMVENSYGFDLNNGRRRAVTLAGLVDNASFRDELLKKGRTWKDPGVNPEHGEFTHRLQYCAAMLMIDPDLGSNWMLIMQRIGSFVDEDPFTYRVDVPAKLFGLWDALLDRNKYPEAGPTPYGTASALDFRSPENLQNWILANNMRDARSGVGLLSTFLSIRKQKRTGAGNYKLMENVISPRREMLEKWSRTLFNSKKVDELNLQERVKLANAWYRINVTEPKEMNIVNNIMLLQDVEAQPPRRSGALPMSLKYTYLTLGLDLEGTAILP